MNVIASERVRLGLSQQDLADELGLRSRQAVAAYEADSGTIPAAKLVAMTRLFGCSADYLLGLTDRRTVA